MEACEWKANAVPYWSCVRELNAVSICIAEPLSRSWFDASNKDICGNLLIQNTSLHEVRYMNGWMGWLSSGGRARWLNVTGRLLVRSSAPPSVDVSLSKTLGRNCSWRAACHLAHLTPLSVCVNRCKSLWIKASAKCPKCKWMPFYFAAKRLSGYIIFQIIHRKMFCVSWYELVHNTLDTFIVCKVEEGGWLSLFRPLVVIIHKFDCLLCVLWNIF